MSPDRWTVIGARGARVRAGISERESRSQRTGCACGSWNDNDEMKAEPCITIELARILVSYTRVSFSSYVAWSVHAVVGAKGKRKPCAGRWDVGLGREGQAATPTLRHDPSRSAEFVHPP